MKYKLTEMYSIDIDYRALVLKLLKSCAQYITKEQIYVQTRLLSKYDTKTTDFMI